MVDMAQPRRNDILVPLFTLVCDAVAIETAFLLSYWIRFFSPFTSIVEVVTEIPPLRAYIEGTLFIIPAWLLIFQSRRMYAVRRNTYITDEFFAIVKVVTIGMLIVMSAAFFYRAFSYSRVVFGLMWLLSIILLSIGRFSTIAFERALYRRGKELRNVALIGSGETALRVLRALAKAPFLGYDIAGYAADKKSPLPGFSDFRYLGQIAGISDIFKREEIELVLIALPYSDHSKIVQLARECEGYNIEVMFVPDMLEIITSRLRVREIEGIPFITIKAMAMSSWGGIFKRIFDLLVSLLLLILLLPLFILITFIIKLDSSGPVFYLQERVGFDGKHFQMIKFRSMKTGAETAQQEIRLGIKNDPRRTRIGIFLRKTSLDELPQLINVLKGEMSLVGPRPERTDYVEKFKKVIPKYLDRHRVKTGMTGWAQVNGLRGDTSLEDRISYDLYYIEHWSFTFDLKILLRTIRELLWSRSAE
ncbi:MAG: undecaprenyl-phosphate glucose phosphotransferase [Bacteroidota bacterium]